MCHNSASYGAFQGLWRPCARAVASCGQRTRAGMQAKFSWHLFVARSLLRPSLHMDQLTSINQVKLRRQALSVFGQTLVIAHWNGRRQRLSVDDRQAHEFGQILEREGHERRYQWRERAKEIPDQRWASKRPCPDLFADKLILSSSYLSF